MAKTPAKKKWAAIVREAAGITAEEMAGQLGVSDPSTVRRWCAPGNETNPGGRHLREIYRLFPLEAAMADRAIKSGGHPEGASDSSATSSGTPAVKGTTNAGSTFLDAELARRRPFTDPEIFPKLQRAATRLRGQVRDTDGAKALLDELLDFYADGVRRGEPG